MRRVSVAGVAFEDRAEDLMEHHDYLFVGTWPRTTGDEETGFRMLRGVR